MNFDCHHIIAPFFGRCVGSNARDGKDLLWECPNAYFVKMVDGNFVKNNLQRTTFQNANYWARNLHTIVRGSKCENHKEHIRRQKVNVVGSSNMNSPDVDYIKTSLWQIRNFNKDCDWRISWNERALPYHHRHPFYTLFKFSNKPSIDQQFNNTQQSHLIKIN